MGIEPTSKAWEAFILPMNYTCIARLLYHASIQFASNLREISPRPEFSERGV
jgi:hypothetical protein